MCRALKAEASWPISATAHQPAWLDQSELGQESVEDEVKGEWDQISEGLWANVKDGAVSLSAMGRL